MKQISEKSSCLRFRFPIAHNPSRASLCADTHPQQETHMSDYTFNMGPLRSAIHIQLHTHNATRLWIGRRATENGPAPIIGMPRFIKILNQMRIAAEHNDPYADLWMLRMEEKLVQSRKLMQVMLDQAKGMFSELPEGIDIENCFNVQPARFPLFINAPLAYQGVYLLTDFDQLARQLLLASHIDLFLISSL